MKWMYQAALNRGVLAGLARDYGIDYAVQDGDRRLPPPLRLLYENDHFSVYKVPAP